MHERVLMQNHCVMFVFNWADADKHGMDSVHAKPSSESATPDDRSRHMVRAPLLDNISWTLSASDCMSVTVFNLAFCFWVFVVEQPKQNYKNCYLYTFTGIPRCCGMSLELTTDIRQISVDCRHIWHSGAIWSRCCSMRLSKTTEHNCAAV